jgi:hypothetical protein
MVQRTRGKRRKESLGADHFSWLVLPHVGSKMEWCDQKTSKFFVSCKEESMVGPVGLKGIY